MTDPTALTECPKCCGIGTVQFKHIEDGTCFLCDRAGECTEAAASNWLAKQARIPHVRGKAVPVSTSSVSMKVDLGPVFGRCDVTHCYGNAPGSFSVRLNAIKDGVLDEYNEYHGGFTVWFRTARGRVTIDRSHMVIGMTCYGNDRPGQLQRALQTAIAA